VADKEAQHHSIYPLDRCPAVHVYMHERGINQSAQMAHSLVQTSNGTKTMTAIPAPKASTCYSPAGTIPIRAGKNPKPVVADTGPLKPFAMPARQNQNAAQTRTPASLAERNMRTRVTLPGWLPNRPSTPRPRPNAKRSRCSSPTSNAFYAWDGSGFGGPAVKGTNLRAQQSRRTFEILQN